MPELTRCDAIPDKMREFVLLLVSFCSIHPEKLGQKKQFQEEVLKPYKIGHKNSVVSKRLKELKGYGVFGEAETHYIQGKRIYLENIKSFATLISYWEKKSSSDAIPHQTSMQLDKEQLDSIGTELSFNDDYESPARIDAIFCIFDSVMKLSGRDKRKVIECEYPITNGEVVKIKALTGSDADCDISHLSDQRVMRAVNGVVLEQLEEKHGKAQNIDLSELKIADEYFWIDIYDLCRKVGLEPVKQNREIVRDMMIRLRDTYYDIDATGSALFREKFCPGGSELTQFRYLTEFSAKSGPSVENKNQIELSRFYLLKLHILILGNLITSGKSFISHPELMTEKSGLAQRLNNWTKSYLGVRKKGDIEVFQYLLNELHEKAYPSSRLDNFMRDLIQLLKRQCNNNQGENGSIIHNQGSTEWIEEGTNIAWLHGYYFKIEWNEELAKELIARRGRRSTKKFYPVISIWRDPDDEYTGDNSKHNKAIRRSAITMLQNQKS